MAASRSQIPFTEIRTSLDLRSTAEVEQLVISAVHAELLDAKINQRDGRVDVRSVRGRELPVEDIPAALAKLDELCVTLCCVTGWLWLGCFTPTQADHIHAH